MPTYQVQDERVLMDVRTSEELAILLSSAPVDMEELELDMLTLDQQPVPIIHRFGPGVYIREAHLRAGLILMGHAQKGPQQNVMLTGRVTMADGTELTSPMAFVGGTGRKCGVIHENTVWLNIYATDEQDIGVIEGMIFNKSEAAITQEWVRASEITNDVLVAREDFQKMLIDLGVSAESVATMTAYDGDRRCLPWGSYSFRTAPSPIHGNGVFASANIGKGDIIGPANIHGKRTVLGYGVNHSGSPNARMVMCGEGLDLIAIREITGNRGGQFGEEITVDYRESRKAALCLVR